MIEQVEPAHKEDEEIEEQYEEIVGHYVKAGEACRKARELTKDYDADYYVNNQVLRAVLKILGALGVSEEDIKTRNSQKSSGGVVRSPNLRLSEAAKPFANAACSQLAGRQCSAGLQLLLS